MPYTYDSAMQAFNNEPGFNRLVKVMEDALEHLDYSPSDLRAAVVFACIRFEQRRRTPSLRLTAEEADKLGIQIIPEKS